MNMKTDIKLGPIDSMSCSLDYFMDEHAFSRQSTSLIYKRKYQGSRQSIDLGVQFHLKDVPSAAAAVYPIM